MTRVYLPPKAWSDSEPVLSREESHHLVDVLRKTEGDEVQVIDGEGRTATGRITNASRKRTSLSLEQVETMPRPEAQPILIQALVREQKMDLVVQKAVELGAGRMVPFIAEQGVVKWKQEKADAKLARWRDIMLNAAKQCGAVWLPEICEPVTLEKALAACGGTPMIYGALGPGAVPLKNVLEKNPGVVAAVIGPEGDFSENELKRLEQAGAQAVSLGPLVLRAETAALFVLSVLGYESDRARSSIQAGRGAAV